MDIKTGAQTTYQIGYHMVWGVKYHKHLLNREYKEALATCIKDVCQAYGYDFYCIGVAPNHVHLFVGAPPKVAPARIAQTLKSITARLLFAQFPKVKQQLWGGEFWKDGYYVGTVGEGQTESIVKKYLETQDKGSVTTTLKQLRFYF